MRRAIILSCGFAFAIGAATAQQPQKPGVNPNEVKVQLTNSAGQPAGTVTFRPVKKGIKMTIKLENIPFGEHAVHIHQNAVCDAPDFHAAGNHLNPMHKQHGFLNPAGHHAGDIPGNVSVGENHRGEASFILTDISLDPNLPNSIFANGGTSVVVHEHADDQKTDPSGESGNRIACGVIRQ